MSGYICKKLCGHNTALRKTQNHKFYDVLSNGKTHAYPLRSLMLAWRHWELYKEYIPAGKGTYIRAGKGTPEEL